MMLRIVQDGELVAQVDGYDGPVPRQGEYIYHPPPGDGGTVLPPPGGWGWGVMSVKAVTYGIIARPCDGEGHFAGRQVPFVEITV